MPFLLTRLTGILFWTCRHCFNEVKVTRGSFGARGVFVTSAHIHILAFRQSAIYKRHTWDSWRFETKELTSPINMPSLDHNLFCSSFPHTSIASVMSTTQGKELTRRSTSTLANSVFERLSRYFILEIESEHSSRSTSHAQVAFEVLIELLKLVERGPWT